MCIFKFEWDAVKDSINQKKHGVSFNQACEAFYDDRRVIHEDLSHSVEEKRWFCFGMVDGGVLTVRFTWRAENNTVRIIGAGYWRKGKSIYEENNQIH